MNNKNNKSNKKRKQSKSWIWIMVIGLVVFGIAGCVLLYKYDNPFVRNLASKVGVNEIITIDNTAWVWEYTKRLDGSIIEASSDKFVLSIMSEENRVTSTTDCNTLMGSYLLNGSSLRFGALASTLMYCTDSMESIYSEQLSLVNSYSIKGSILSLTLDREFGTMVFKKR